MTYFTVRDMLLHDGSSVKQRGVQRGEWKGMYTLCHELEAERTFQRRCLPAFATYSHTFIVRNLHTTVLGMHHSLNERLCVLREDLIEEVRVRELRERNHQGPHALKAVWGVTCWNPCHDWGSTIVIKPDGVLFNGKHDAE